MSRIRSSRRWSQSVWEETTAFVELLESRRLLSVTVTTLASFNGSDGANPFADLTLSGNTLYGTTSGGGANGDGEVFSLPVTGGTPTALASFNGSDGAVPKGGLTLLGDTLYGTTAIGGAYGSGTVFSVPVAGGTPALLASFNGGNGQDPQGDLVLSGSTIYGTTEYGDGNGTVYSLPINGGTPTVLAGFDLVNGGSHPAAGLTLSGNTLYGTASLNGPNGDGVIFSLSVTGGTPKMLASFDDQSGRYPEAGLTLSGNTIYGTAATLGPGDDGTVFSVPVTGGTPTVLASFNNSNGASLGSGLTLFGDTLYGTARFGGDGGDGTVFSVPVTGGTPTVLASFNGSDGEEPEAGLALSGNTLYGSTYGGGAESDGTVFKITGAVATPAITLTVPSNQTAKAGTTASLSLGSFSQTNATAPYADTINWGDGSANTVMDLGSAGTIPATPHTFAKAGTLIVSQTIVDANGYAGNTATFHVVVSPASLPASKLAFAASPGSATAGNTLKSAVVDVENSAGQIVTSDSSTVTLSIISGPSGAKLGGTVTATANKGIATFSNLVLNTAGTYVLKATDGSLASGNTVAFTVTPTTAAKVVFSTVPGKAVHNTAFTLKVSIEDAFSNLVTTNTTKVTIAIASGPSGGALSGTTSVSAVSGVAIFSTLKFSKTGKYTLKATDGSLTVGVSAIITVS
jgi:uncharacterized repeat protein (TIGR03803 family)